MENLFEIGATIQVNWTLNSITGSAFSLTGYTYRLHVSCGNEDAFATGVTHSGNVLSWTFHPTGSWKKGAYTLWLDILQNGEEIITITYPNAFHLISRNAADVESIAVQTGNATLNLVSSCDIYRFAPVCPVVGDDGYWYVNGVKITDENGEYVPSFHTVDFIPSTKQIIIDKDRVDKDGNSLAQVITAIADLDSFYAAAEGSQAGSSANDGSRWGSYKAAEASRDSAHATAEGNSSSLAGDGSRWGAFKSSEAARNLVSDAAAQRANNAAEAAEHMVDIKTGPDGKSAYQLALDNGFEGTIEQWFMSLTGPQGVPGVNNTIMRIVTALPANASQDTLDKVFLIYNSTSEEYDRYYTAFDGTNYSFVQMGSMAIDLDDYVRKDSEVWLTQEQFDALAVKDSTKTYNIYEIDDEIEVEEPEEESEET